MTDLLAAHVSTSALEANIALLRGLLPSGVRLCAVVKADCYGHGWDACLHTIAGLADWLAVATADEAIGLRRRGVELPILVFFTAGSLGGPDRAVLDELIERDVTLTLTDASEVELVSSAADRVDRPARVHVKIDTGMSRSGVCVERAGELIARARRAERVELSGLYTHFASADEPDKASARAQLRRFLSACESAGGRGELIRHAAGSAGTIDLPESHLDMVRPGIALYGYPPGDGLHTRLPLRPTLRMVGSLMQVRDVPAGAAVGYGRTWRFERAGRIGLVGVGYADGYRRAFSNRAVMRVAGRDVPVRGRVSMDQTVIDLTEIPDARVGDEVEIISTDPDAPNSVQHLARLADTIPYEITCGLGRRVRRVRVD